MQNTENNAAPKIARAMHRAGIAENINRASGVLTDNSKVVLERRYLTKDATGKTTEDPEGMFRRVARNLSQADLNYNNTQEEERQQTEEEFYNVMSRLFFLPNSPTLMNAGNRLQQLSACFVLPIEDSLESIFETVRDTALIHKSGGGTGFSFSKIRPRGDIVGSTGGVASGPVSFIRVFNSATEEVKQGSTRRGANMGILNVNHPDILEFIESKKDQTQLVNFNISVAAPDEFMQAVIGDREYELINPRNGEATGTLSARKVFDLITDTAWETGDPGIVFIDRLDGGNPNPQLGRIESTNPCGEQPLLPYESCNLGSINLSRMLIYDGQNVEINWDRLDSVIATAVHMLDNIIDMNHYPVQQIAAVTRSTRRIGVGVMGFSDLLVQLGIQYDSQQAVDLARSLMAHIQEQTHRCSRKLSDERGVYPAWDASVYNNGQAQSDTDPSQGSRPMRNSAPVTIAPTGTISIIAGASSGIEPLFALSYVRNVMDQTRLMEVNPHFEAVAKDQGFYSEELMEQLARTGTLEDTDVPQWVKNVFRTSRDIDPSWHVRMQDAFQSHTDNAVSKTINFPATATRDDVRKAYMMAYESSCKGITIYRDGSKDQQVLSTGADGPETAPAPESRNGATQPQLPNMPVKRGTSDRPRQVWGVTERIRTGHGNMYVTINFDGDKQPFELFTNLGKAGGCDSAQLEAISRLASMALRSGVDVQEIIYNLRGITCCPAWDEGVQILSAPDAVAISLARHVEESEAGQPPRHDLPQGFRAQTPAATGRSLRQAPKCPDCSAPVEYQEGCESCTNPRCGWNRCN